MDVNTIPVNPTFMSVQSVFGSSFSDASLSIVSNNKVFHHVFKCLCHVIPPNSRHPFSLFPPLDNNLVIPGAQQKEPVNLLLKSQNLPRIGSRLKGLFD